MLSVEQFIFVYSVFGAVYTTFYLFHMYTDSSNDTKKTVSSYDKLQDACE
jgi:hypothetical protein